MKKNYNYSEIKKNLKWFLEAGVDETISEFPRNLIDFSKKKDLSFDNKKNIKKIKNNNEVISKNFSELKNIIFQQSTIKDLQKSLINLIKNNYIIGKETVEEKNFFFGEGSYGSKYVFVFECYYTLFKRDYNLQSEKRKELLKNIILTIKKLSNLSDDDFFYFSYFPIPLNDLESKEKELRKLFDLYFLKYLNLLNPKKIIFFGNFFYDRLEEVKKIDFEKKIIDEYILLPGLDLMLRAPERKKEAWKKLIQKI